MAIEGSTQQEKLLREVVSAMQAKKARRVTLLDLRGIDKAVCDYFVICHADSAPHIRSIAEEVEDRVGSALGEWPLRMSGKENALWIVMDYFTVVVHVFSTAMREFYDLDSLWSDAKRTEFPDED